MTNLSTQIAHIRLPNCLYNASGAHCMRLDELLDLENSEAGAVLSKSCTEEPRSGNAMPRYYENAWGSLNAMGLPNLGCQFYGQYARQRPQNEKPYLVSVAGMSLSENEKIIAHLGQIEQISALEVNLSCPNLPGKPQTGYDMEQTDKMLATLSPMMSNMVWGLKLPPYFDVIHFNEVAAILNNYPISFVTCINSLGNALLIDIDSEQVLIKPKNGLGGLGGNYVKPTALANVHQFYTLLRPDIAIIGCGGVATGADAFEHILCGASAVQIGTTLVRDGINCFMRIKTELEQIMQQKSYCSLNDFKGKLKYIA